MIVLDLGLRLKTPLVTTMEVFVISAVMFSRIRLTINWLKGFHHQKDHNQYRNRFECLGAVALTFQGHLGRRD